MAEESTAAEAAKRFLERFFAPPNKFLLPDIESGRAPRAAALRPWMELLTAPERNPSVLPCWREDGSVTWYGLAFSERQLRALSEDLLAFVGPTYSTFRGPRSDLDMADPMDAAVLDFTGGHALKFTAPSDRESGSALFRALELMRGVQQRRPVHATGVPRPTGRVLRDFFISLQAGDRGSAERHLRYLGDEFRLDPVNLLFLRVQALAELGDWEGVLTSRDLPDLIRMRRPVAVTHALLKAVYRHELARFEYDDDATGAVEHFRSLVYPRYGALFSSRSGLHSADVLKAFMLFAVAGPIPSPTLRDELLDAAPSSPADTAYLRHVAAILPTPAPAHRRVQDPIIEAIAAEHRGDHDLAFGLAVAAPESLDRARLLIDSAYGLQTLEAMRVAIASVEALSENDRGLVAADRRRRDAFAWIELQCAPPEEDAPTVPANWYEWLTAVEHLPDWSRAQQVARQGAIEWDLVAFLEHPDGARVFAERLRSARDQATIHNALPHLLAFFQADAQWPRRDLAEVYYAMLEVLAYSSTGADEDFVVVHELAQGILGLGISEDLYAELLGWACYLLTQFPALARIDWGMDMLDLMVVYPAPNPDLRLNVLSAVATQFQRFSTRVQPEQAALFRSLCGELQCPEVADALATSSTAGSDGNAAQCKVDPLTLLGARTVAIYTLTESVARRARERILEHSPDTNVQVSSDRVGTDRLRQLSRQVDIFVVATASATHAATGFIDSHRPRGTATLRPSGKGTASLLRSLRDYLRTTGVVPTH